MPPDRRRDVIADATNAVFHRPQVALENNSNNNHAHPLLNVRDRLFHALFYKLSIAYARLVPIYFRRLIEFTLLLEAVLSFFILIYMHFIFLDKPPQCLNEVKDTWPKDGILRVEIFRNSSPDYTLEQSYEKEELIRDLKNSEYNLFIATVKIPVQWYLKSTIKIPRKEISDDTANSTSVDTASENNQLVAHSAETGPDDSEIPTNEYDVTMDEVRVEEIHSYFDFFFSAIFELISGFKEFLFCCIHEWKTSHPFMPFYLLSSISDDCQIAEFALEHGLLRLSREARVKHNISVHLVVLDPLVNPCFGDKISLKVFHHVIGYGDFLMGMFRDVSDSVENKGYVRNVVTGDHFRYVLYDMSKYSYVMACFVMMLFTFSISLLLRYSHHQIFLFIVNLLQTFEVNSPIIFPLAPLLSVVLSLVGIESIMSEFFHDKATAFYIIVLVWLADQYDAICCQCAITKKYWLKFFYLYLFAFYAYHYRFAGNLSSLSLATSCLFIAHSMLYFYHHYELPVVIQHYQLHDAVMQRQRDRHARAAHRQEQVDRQPRSRSTPDHAQAARMDNRSAETSDEEVESTRQDRSRLYPPVIDEVETEYQPPSVERNFPETPDTETSQRMDDPFVNAMSVASENDAHETIRYNESSQDSDSVEGATDEYTPNTTDQSSSSDISIEDNDHRPD